MFQVVVSRLELSNFHFDQNGEIEREKNKKECYIRPGGIFGTQHQITIYMGDGWKMNVTSENKNGHGSHFSCPT